MDRLISEQQVLYELVKLIDKYGQINHDEAMKAIKAIPSAEPKTGHWIFEGNQCFSCSSCGRIYTQKAFEYLKLHKDDSDFPNNCPNCGVKMVEPQESEEQHKGERSN